MDGPPIGDVAAHARRVAHRFAELHPDVDVDVDDLAHDAEYAVSRWEQRHGRLPSTRRALALMRTELFRHIKDRPGR